MPAQLAELAITSATADEMPFEQLGTVDDDEVGGSPKLTGDIDAAWEQAATVGDEAVVEPSPLLTRM